jgi:hypothetical protein
MPADPGPDASTDAAQPARQAAANAKAIDGMVLISMSSSCSCAGSSGHLLKIIAIDLVDVHINA